MQTPINITLLKKSIFLSISGIFRFSNQITKISLTPIISIFLLFTHIFVLFYFIFFRFFKSLSLLYFLYVKIFFNFFIYNFIK